MRDAKYNVVAIVQATPEKEALKTAYLAELLELSLDRPTNLYRFNSQEGRYKLLANPLVKEVSIKKIRPGTIYIDYVLRKPIAFLVDYSNTAIDAEGVLFPYKPFFTPKKWPEIYLGAEACSEEFPTLKIWKTELKGRHSKLALILLNHISCHYCSERSRLRRIDVSQAYASSCGQRQIVVVIEDQIEREINGRTVLFIFPRILRLGTDNYQQGLANYRVLYKHLIENIPQKLESEEQIIIKEPTIIDLRLPQLAFIKEAS